MVYILFFIIGVIAGMLNVIRVLKECKRGLDNGNKSMHQFQVYKIGPEIKLGNLDLSFTNMFIYAYKCINYSSSAFLGSKNKVLFKQDSIIAELIYNFISKMISDTAGSKAKPYFPFIFSLFMFVLFCNMIGMLPYAFTVTSHIIVTLVMALFIFISVI